MCVLRQSDQTPLPTSDLGPGSCFALLTAPTVQQLVMAYADVLLSSPASARGARQTGAEFFSLQEHCRDVDDFRTSCSGARGAGVGPQTHPAEIIPSIPEKVMLASGSGGCGLADLLELEFLQDLPPLLGGSDERAPATWDLPNMLPNKACDFPPTSQGGLCMEEAESGSPPLASSTCTDFEAGHCEEQEAAAAPDPCPEPDSAGRKRKGRPRLFNLPNTFTQAKPGDVVAHKRRRGAKPKYLFSTKEAAVAHRRHRNRETALSSYYRRKQHVDGLQSQRQELMKEQSALMRLLEAAKLPDFDSGCARQLLQQTQSGVQTLAAMKLASGDD
ncbi:hypothetical protein WJX73_000922 [Symbiochloris irregularis]|uniref:BZIP domain-containing protein n=1 Tax=Symbiochloris irregularis TaxID=706552 RepID=A0AAW1NP16_9CHLO